MELIPNDVCMLCEENTAVLASRCLAPYWKYLAGTFFDNSKKTLAEFQQSIVGRSLCVLCTHKVTVSHKFKDIYEELAKKRTFFRQTRTVCFLCESKAEDFIQTDDNPNNFIKKIESFMKSTVHPRPYLQCVSCFDCLFYLNTWFEIQSNIVKKLNSEEILELPATPPNGQSETFNNNRSLSLNKTPKITFGRKKDKENITPPKSSTRGLKAILSESEASVDILPEKMGRNTRNIVNSPGSKMAAKNKTKNNENKKFHLFLCKTLKCLQSVKQINSGVKWPKNIVLDNKMFAEIPYVLITKDDDKIDLENDVSKPVKKSTGKIGKKKVPKKNTGVSDEEDGTRRSIRLNKPVEVIELSDSDSDGGNKQETPVVKRFIKFNQRSPPTKSPIKKQISKLSLKKSTTKKKSPRKPAIKIKVSNKFLQNLEHTEEETNYSCNICDQLFTIRCEYKIHSLWHDKPEAVVINVVRRNLPTHIKASQFNSDQLTNEEKSKSPAEIDNIVKKYLVGPSDTFEDADFTHSNEIDNIIENLDSLDKDEKLEQNQNKKELIDEDKQEKELDGEEDDTNDKTDIPDTDKDNDSTVTSKEMDSEPEVSKTEEAKDLSNIVPEEVASESGVISNDESEDDKQTKDDNVEDAVSEASVQSKQNEPEGDGSCTNEETADENNEEEEDSFVTTCSENKEQSTNAKPLVSIENELAFLHGENPVLSDSNELDNDTSNISEKVAVVSDEENESQEDISEAIDSEESDDNNDLLDLSINSAGKHGENEESGDAIEANHLENGDEKETSFSNTNNHDVSDDDQQITKKRKREDSLSVHEEGNDEDSDDEIVTPKAKKVRFAMDYQSAKSTENETVPEVIFDEAEDAVRKDTVIDTIASNESEFATPISSDDDVDGSM